MNNIDFTALSQAYSVYLQKLGNFEFTVSNPLLWIFLVIIFLILAMLWTGKKAGSFCLVVTGLLLGTTWIEKVIQGNIGAYDRTLVRILFFLVLGCVVIYYSMIKGDE